MSPHSANTVWPWLQRSESAWEYLANEAEALIIEAKESHEAESQQAVEILDKDPATSQHRGTVQAALQSRYCPSFLAYGLALSPYPPPLEGACVANPSDCGVPYSVGQVLLSNLQQMG